MKNPGPTLTTTIRGGFRNIPDNLLAKIGVQVQVTEVDPAVTEDTVGSTVGGVGTIIESKCEQERTDERKRTTTILKNTTRQPLVDYIKTPFGQLATHTTEAVPENSVLPVDALTEDAKQDNTGTGLLIQETTTVPSVPQEIELATEGNDPIPDKFKNIAPDVLQTQAVVIGTAAQPLLNSNQLKVSEKQLTIYRKLVTQWQRAGTLASMLPLTLINYRINDNGQVVTVRETLQVTTANPNVSATFTYTVQDLGNGTQVVTTESIPGVFAGTTYEVSKPDVIPEDFKATLPLTETENVVAATSVSLPTLGTNDLRASEQQLTAFTKMVKLLQRQGISLPVSLVGHDTNDKKQDVIVTRTLQSAVTIIPSPNELRDVVSQPLGDGNVLVTTRVVATLFLQPQVTIQRNDAIPPEFMALITQTTTSTNIVGSAPAPTLADETYLRQTNEQIDATTYRSTTTKKSGVASDTQLDANFEVVTEFGGGIAQRVKILSLAGLSVSGLSKLVISDKVTDVGYAGWQVREYLILIKDATGTNTLVWPTLSGTAVDESGELVTPFTEQVVDAGTTGGISSGIITEVRPIDFLRSMRTVRAAPGNIDTLIQMFPGYSTIRDIPPQLNSVTGLANTGGGAGSYSESAGTYSITAPGSASISLHGNARGSAVIIRDLTYDLTIPRTVDVRVSRWVFYIPYGTDLTAQLLAIIARLVAAGLTGVNVLPRFFPRVETFYCPGQRQTAEIQANVTAVDHAGLDYLGNPVGIGKVRTGGVGSSFEVELSTKVIRLPPTIHPLINVTNASIGNATSSAAATIAIADSSTQSLSKVVQVLGTDVGITPISISATPETTAIPTGLIITDIHTEPYKYARMKVFAEVCDFGAEVV